MLKPVRAQQGAVLMFSLIVLLLLTVIGVAAMQTTILQERMAGSQRDRQLAFQGAEAAIREAERMLNAAVLPDFNAQGGRYDEHNVAYRLPKTTVDHRVEWNLTMDGANTASYGGGTFEGLLMNPPEYVIERLPPAARLGGVVEADASVSEDEVFRVTARSTGGSGRAVVIIQTIFRR
jgi:type IV pilus assembly protein PilX